MGIIQKLIHDDLIPSVPDRHSNLLRVYEKENGEIVIHFRNLKINLISPEQIAEWREGFAQALIELKDNLQNDI